MSRSHSFSVDVAAAYDVDTALMLQHICFWYLKVVSDKVNKHNNEHWVRMKLTQMQAQFPYWSIKQIRRIVDNCLDQDLLKKGEFNDKKSDRTKWYTLTKKSKNLLNISTQNKAEKPTAQMGNNTSAQMGSPSAQMGNSIYKEVDIKDRYLLIYRKIEKNVGLLELVAMQNKLNLETVKNSISLFAKQSSSVNEFYNNDTELFKHFQNYVRTQSEKLKSYSLEKELEWFINVFNQISKRDFKITDTVRTRFAQQFAVGYSGADMRKAIANLYSSAVGNKFHINNQFKFATPEYLLKGENLNKYLNFKVA